MKKTKQKRKPKKKNKKAAWGIRGGGRMPIVVRRGHARAKLRLALDGLLLLELAIGTICAAARAGHGRSLRLIFFCVRGGVIMSISKSPQLFFIYMMRVLQRKCPVPFWRPQQPTASSQCAAKSGTPSKRDLCGSCIFWQGLNPGSKTEQKF